MNLLAVSIIALAAIIIPSSAFAYEYTTLVETDHQFQSDTCYWALYTVDPEKNYTVYVCYLFFDIPLDEFATFPGLDGVPKPPAQVEPEVIEEPEIIEEIIQPEKELTTDEQLIQRLESIPEEKIDPSQKQLLIYLKAAKESCFFGIEEGEAIQNYQHVLIPKEYVDLNLAMDLASVDPLLRHFEQVIEACDGWKKYKGVKLGPEYLHKIEDGKKAIQEELSRLDELHSRAYPSQKITEHDRIEASNKAWKKSEELGYIGNKFTDPNKGGYVDVTNNPVYKKYLEAMQTENIPIKPRFDVKTDPKCATLQAYTKQYNIPEDNAEAILKEAGCSAS